MFPAKLVDFRCS